jgi:hypothetical protein
MTNLPDVGLEIVRGDAHNFRGLRDQLDSAGNSARPMPRPDRWPARVGHLNRDGLRPDWEIGRSQGP